MKIIYLKPKLEIAEEVIYKEKTYIVDAYNKNVIVLKGHGRLFALQWDNITIIESPDEPDHIADAGKMVEEKPPLKLRVDGVYKNRLGEIVKISHYDPTLKQGLNFIQSGGKFSFREDGTYRFYGDCKVPLCPYDLIEEVQQEEKSTVAEKEPSGNPFKVGEAVKIFGANFIRGNYIVEIVTGVIENISGDILHIRSGICTFACHYKQCELWESKEIKVE